MFRLGFFFFMNNISYIKQSSFPLHFLRTAKLLVTRSLMVLISCSFLKCLPIAYLFIHLFIYLLIYLLINLFIYLFGRQSVENQQHLPGLGFTRTLVIFLS